MKFPKLYITAASVAIAIATMAIAQDATTQPAQDDASANGDRPANVDRPANTDRPTNADRLDNSEAPTSRPANNSRFDNFRNNRRDRNNNQRRFGQQNVASNSQSSQQALYEQVGARNIFVKGNQQTPEVIVNQGPTMSDAQRYAMQQESQLVLTGVSLADNGKIALLEDHSDYSVKRLKIGDPVANGKVVDITLDTLDYKDNNGRIVRVGVGFNLTGGDVWGVSGSSSASSGGASTQPAKSGPRMPGESMEDYLKRRRAAEVGH
jgi:hypothetical protein